MLGRELGIRDGLPLTLGVPLGKADGATLTVGELLGEDRKSVV